MLNPMKEGHSHLSLFHREAVPRYEDGEAVFEMGEHTLRIPMTLHADNRRRLVQRLAATDGVPSGKRAFLAFSLKLNRIQVSVII